MKRKRTVRLTTMHLIKILPRRVTLNFAEVDHRKYKNRQNEDIKKNHFSFWPQIQAFLTGYPIKRINCPHTPPYTLCKCSRVTLPTTMRRALSYHRLPPFFITARISFFPLVCSALLFFFYTKWVYEFSFLLVCVFFLRFQRFFFFVFTSISYLFVSLLFVFVIAYAYLFYMPPLQLFKHP